MNRTSFNLHWRVGPKTGPFAALTGDIIAPQSVTLPHDAIRDLPRSSASDQGSHTGYYPGGAFTYSKTFDVPESWREKVVIIEFEGVYRDAMVSINSDFAAQRPNGYSGFTVKADAYLRYGQPNTITVDAQAHQDSRWYSGAGIYRSVNLMTADPVHLALNGVQVTTPDIDTERAIVAVATTIENETRATHTVRIETQIVDADGQVVASGSVPVTLLPGTSAVSRLRLTVSDPALWSPDSPALYEVHTTLHGDGLSDEERCTFGIRRLQIDPQHGLRLNGQPIKLRGACIHHDNGLLGAATISRAEERRIEILKAAGFNAIRSAHNPISRAALATCDRIGMLVMDELTDMWTRSKRPFDYSLAFPEWWERDVEAMVAKDFNHPCVILYSTGNEIAEVGTPIGSTWGRKLAEKIRSLDTTRCITNNINGLLAGLDQLRPLMAAAAADQVPNLNQTMTSMGEMMNQLTASEIVTLATEEAAASLDVVGFSYGDARYAADAVRFPNRVIVGSETFPAHIDVLWQLVQMYPHVIGDFTWTGWDYLGEAGIGRTDYLDEVHPTSTGIAAAYPFLLANTGDIDITGQRRTISHYREIVFGLRHTPYIAVHRPENHGKSPVQTPWSWTDTISSWSWNIPAGSPIIVDVYTDADAVELLLDGRSLGTAQVGVVKPFLARFETTYEPGELTAVARTAMGEQARTSLKTASGSLYLEARCDRSVIRADDQDLAYVEIALRDDHGILVTHRDRLVAVTVEGSGLLAGLGTGRPRTEETFSASTVTTYDGRALAIIRPIAPGEITVKISAGDCDSVSFSLHAELQE